MRTKNVKGRTVGVFYYHMNKYGNWVGFIEVKGKRYKIEASDKIYSTKDGKDFRFGSAVEVMAFRDRPQSL